jgi:hypothetical protein
MPQKDTGIAPLKIFCGCKLEKEVSSHVWGCPSYVLDPKIQDGKKISQEEDNSLDLASIMQV